jgi:hypothetical protein
MRRTTPSPLLADAEKAAQRMQQLPPPTAEQQTLREAAGLKFELLCGGSDVRFLDGRFPGKTVTDLVRTVEGRDYLGTLWRTAPRALRTVILSFLGA